MNFNVWNIKEMLSTPTASGPNKLFARSGALSDYSSLSDSQVLFGSQFCPENAQSAAPLELGMQLGQHNSQDSEPSIFTKYQAKPQLFDEDTREKGLLNFGAAQGKRVLENFKANNNKIKDKYDREVLSTFISSINNRLQGLQACLDNIEKEFNSRNKSISVHLESISKTLQDALQSHSDVVLKALEDKSQMEQALLEMERRLAAKDVDISDVKSSVLQLKEGLESLPAQLSDHHLKLCEELRSLKLPSALAELQTFMTSAKVPPRMVDNSSQTSPGTCQDRAPRQQKAHWPCCHGTGGCSSLGLSAAGKQHRVSGDVTPRGGLDAPSESKVSPVATAAYGGEVESALVAQSCSHHPCACSANSQLLGDGRKKPIPVLQEISPVTPLRKAVRRGTSGFKPVTPSQQRQPQACHLFVQSSVSGQRDGSSSTDQELENIAIGNKAKLKLGRIPWNKVMERKKTHPGKRKGELARCADGGLKQVRANRIIGLGSTRKNCFPRYTVALSLASSNPIPAAPHQQKLSSAQPRLTKSFLPVSCSNKSMLQLADQRKRSLENRKRAIAASVRRDFWDSSPQESLFSLCRTGEKQASCSTGSTNPCPGNVQGTECCSLVFDSDYSD
ncbi:interactor of HORMAD1 protein 1 [Centrocercus urophasianus]|uniref:interactor of HORMAD1 protein 1 n=1 Tax=Centrocercus urophasianus TaxID=9002 RepID=UPI001C645AE7|nr:interactor of HORMAD1 protein 1 [Centrocercus urophasianus]